VMNRDLNEVRTTLPPWRIRVAAGCLGTSGDSSVFAAIRPDFFRTDRRRCGFFGYLDRSVSFWTRQFVS
jgi:hypothetical protein